MLVFFVWVAWFMLLFRVIGDIFRRHDASGFAKVLWLIFVIVLPFLGVFIYLIANNKGMTERSIARAQAQQQQFDQYVQSAAGSGGAAGALIGLGADGEAGMVAGAEAGAAAMADGVHVLSEEQAWDVVEDIPNDSAAAIMLVEHRWAIPLHDAILRAGGFPISDGFIHPLDLVAIGLITAEEAEAVPSAT